MWYNWTNVVLGLVIVLVAFLGLSGTTLMWTLSILGALIAIVGFLGAGANTGSSRSAAKMV